MLFFIFASLSAQSCWRLESRGRKVRTPPCFWTNVWYLFVFLRGGKSKIEPKPSNTLFLHNVWHILASSNRHPVRLSALFCVEISLLEPVGGESQADCLHTMQTVIWELQPCCERRDEPGASAAPFVFLQRRKWPHSSHYHVHGVRPSLQSAALLGTTGGQQATGSHWHFHFNGAGVSSMNNVLTHISTTLFWRQRRSKQQGNLKFLCVETLSQLLWWHPS